MKNKYNVTRWFKANVPGLRADFPWLKERWIVELLKHQAHAFFLLYSEGWREKLGEMVFSVSSPMFVLSCLCASRSHKSVQVQSVAWGTPVLPTLFSTHHAHTAVFGSVLGVGSYSISKGTDRGELPAGEAAPCPNPGIGDEPTNGPVTLQQASPCSVLSLSLEVHPSYCHDCIRWHWTNHFLNMCLWELTGWCNGCLCVFAWDICVLSLYI